jgi:hypothetical protein
MRWSEEKVWEWYKNAGRIIGCNYFPATAINSTEMWQKADYDRETANRELKLASSAGFNSARVLLQFIVWEAERESFMANFQDFLSIADSNGISVMPIFFDDCAFSGKEPYLGKQDAPRPGVHNGGQTSSPGMSIADDPAKEAALREYVQSVIQAHRDDRRIIAWDLYNEPGNSGRGEKCLPLARNSFKWAREINPVQPLTTGLWASKDYELEFAELSDLISFHDYLPLDETIQRLEFLKSYKRPIMCTEWLHRPRGNSFESHFPFFMRENVGIYNWGLVLGKTQTNLDWSTINGDPEPNPPVWQHDIFYPDYTPYNKKELDIIREYAKKAV